MRDAPVAGRAHRRTVRQPRLPRLPRLPSMRSSRNCHRFRPRSGRMYRPYGSRPGRQPSPGASRREQSDGCSGQPRRMRRRSAASARRCAAGTRYIPAYGWRRSDRGRNSSDARPYSPRPSRLKAAARRAPALPDWALARRRTGMISDRDGAALRRKRSSCVSPSLRGRHPPAHRNRRHRRHGSARYPNA